MTARARGGARAAPPQCGIGWCREHKDLMRRKPGTPLFRRFGAIILCRGHVPPWLQDQYEPLPEQRSKD